MDTLSVPDAARQPGAITRYVAQTREDLSQQEKDGEPPALDAGKALNFAHEAKALSLTDADADGETVAVIVFSAVLEVLEDALGLLQGELDRRRGTATPITSEDLRNDLKGRTTS